MYSNAAINRKKDYLEMQIGKGNVASPIQIESMIVTNGNQSDNKTIMPTINRNFCGRVNNSI